MKDLLQARVSPFFKLLDSYRRIKNNNNPYDAQEQKERENAAGAYAKENEQHFVDYGMDCIKTSAKAREDIRLVQEECYRVYKEKEPFSYGSKQPWQSRIVVPKPYNTIQFAAGAIRKAFSPEFLSIEDAQNQGGADFWQKAMTTQLDSSHANFVIRFVDATTMGLAVGESMELKPRWVPGKGLSFVLAEPWKIFRDPDASPRDPQSGVYWIHQEWMDYHLLKQRQKQGVYENIEEAFATRGEMPDNPFMTKDAIAARKEQIWQRSKFRKMLQVSEFWGKVLSPNGELLLERATFTFGGGRVIKRPTGVRFKTLRWPGMMFSPQPDLLGLGGRGLLEGIRTIWESMCNLMCLHEDAMKWLVNPMTEINVDGLLNAGDVQIFPGKRYLTQDTMNGQQVVRTVSRRDVTGSVLANLQYYDQNYQRGTAVTDAVQGLPGYRKDITWRESEQNLSQGMEVFNLMGTNVELGAIQALTAAQEVVETYAGYEDYVAMLGQEELTKANIQVGNKGVIEGLPKMTGAFHVSGIQKLMKDAETLSVIVGTVMPMAESGRFAPFVRPYQAIRALEIRTGLKDENIFLSKEEGEALEKIQLQAMLNPPDAEPGATDDQGGGE